MAHHLPVERSAIDRLFDNETSETFPERICSMWDESKPQTRIAFGVTASVLAAYMMFGLRTKQMRKSAAMAHRRKILVEDSVSSSDFDGDEDAILAYEVAAERHARNKKKIKTSLAWLWGVILAGDAFKLKVVV